MPGFRRSILTFLALTACATSRTAAPDDCGERCELGRAALLPILAVERARAPEGTVFCVTSEMVLTTEETERILERARTLGLEAWSGADCARHGGPRLGVHVRQVQRTTAAEEWWFPFEISAAVDDLRSGSALVCKERGHWRLLRLEYDDWRPVH